MIFGTLFPRLVIMPTTSPPLSLIPLFALSFIGSIKPTLFVS